ncbi:alpha/beta fold hydrolase [Pseudomonas sp. GB2N2]
MTAHLKPPSADNVVIVGAACRLPGSKSLSAYWQNLMAGQRCVAPVTRWESLRGTAMHGGLLEHVDEFDAGFFRISPNEARCMDPQQRLLMETVQHLIDDCGVPVQTLRDLHCGVFCTGLPGDYKFLLAQEPASAFSSHSFLGNAASSLAGRVSYFYDFHGPSVSLDTACSSSLTALQIAVSQLRAGECEAALVAGVSVFATPEVFEFAQRSNMLSARGHCDAFSDEADGFVPAEGVAAIMLMTASKARTLGLEVLASVEAISLNHDGISNGMMAPNSRAQAALIAGSYERYGIDVGRVGYVEAHGTGTRLGDAIEVAGLVNGFRAQAQPYDAYLGASKSVIGHTLVCSGLASLIKTLLIFRHGTIPGQLLAGSLNSALDLDQFKISEQAVPWPSDKTFACVSAFGFTGSNAHLVLGKPEPRQIDPQNSPGPWAFLISAQTAASLHARVRQVLGIIEGLPDDQLEALSVALGKGSQSYRLRLAVTASTSDSLVTQLKQWLGTPPEQLGVGCSKVEGLADPMLAERLQRWLAGTDLPLYGTEHAARYRRIELPGYPFDRKSYWVGTELIAAQVPVSTSSPRQGNVLDTLKSDLALLLGFDQADIDTSRSLRDYGVDSISLIELLSRLGAGASRMQPHDVFDFASIAALSEALEGLQPDSIVASWADAVVPVGRLPMTWTQTGQGRAIVLLPPLNMSAQAWMQQVNVLTRQGFALHIPSYPGHQGTPLDEGRFSLEGLVLEIEGYINEQLKGRPAPVVGWSLGGCLALALCRRAPAMVESMILISTAARFGDDIFGKTIELNAELQAHADYLDILLEPRQSIAEQVGAGASMSTLSYYYQMLGQLDLSAQLPSIGVRTLIVHGQQDVAIAGGDVKLLQHLPNARLEVFSDQGHFIPLTAARRFNELLLDFV